MKQLLVIANSQDKNVRVVGVFSFDEIAVEYDMTDFPQPKDIKGKRAELFYDKETKQLYYEYIDLPKTEIELLQEETQKLKLAIAESAEAQQQDKLENQLAIAEVAELIAPKEVL